MAKPNLFLIGAMKSGSTALSRRLREHPDIFMSHPKEPSYFVDSEQLRSVYPSIWKLGFWRKEENYLALFEEAKGSKIIGEASQNYARLPRVTGVPERIFKFNPDARFIYIMRDPIERTISHYWYMVNHFGERRDMLTAIQQEPDYMNTSHYAMQLATYIDFFGLEKIKIITMEDLNKTPLAVMQELYSWLGVNPEFEPPRVDERANATPLTSNMARGLGLLHKFRHSQLWSRMSPFVPPQLRRLGRTLSERKIPRGSISTELVENYLRPVQLAQTKELEKLLGKKFPQWQTLYADLATRTDEVYAQQ